MRTAIESLKRDAKRVSKTTGCSHSAALDAVARKLGHDNWSLLMKERGPERRRYVKAISQPAGSLTAIKAVMEREPYLTNFGFGVFEGNLLTRERRIQELEIGRNAMSSSVEEFERACEWLQKVRRTKDVSRRLGSSYSLKHRVENYFRANYPDEDYYVSNGMFIAAAIHLGFMVKSIPDSPNAWLNIAKLGLPPGSGPGA